MAEFRALYDKFCPLVWKWVARLGIPAHAIDDVVQEVFLTVYAKLDQFEGRAALKTWVFAITLRTTRNYRRRRSSRPSGDDDCEVDELAGAHDGVDHPEALAERTEELTLLQQILNGLDEEKREVFVLSELEQFSAHEIGSLLEISTNTVVSRLRLAREEVRAAWSRARARDQWRLR